MHELHYKILSVNDECYSLISSIEEPFIYLIGKFRINQVEKFSALRYKYSLELIELLDDIEFINDYFIQKTFRLKKGLSKNVWNKTINIDISRCINGIDVAEEFLRFVDYDKYFISLAPLVFEDLESCIESLKKYELIMANKWATDLRIMSNRQNRFK